MGKNLLRLLLRNTFLVCLIFLSACSGCTPTYPKEKLAESVESVCRNEYDIEIQAKLVGKTIVVFIPLDELFDLKLEILPEAIEKIENVILTTSRVLFSTDADVNFYMIIAADVKTTAAEVILVRYMDDVYKFMHGWIKREDYRKRVLWQISFDPDLLKNPFFDFDIEEITLPDFLAQLIAQRLNQIFSTSVAHKIKMKAWYGHDMKKFFFSTVAADNNRFKKIYLPVIINTADQILEDYKFEDFKEFIVKNEFSGDSVVIDRKTRLEYRRIKVDELLALPADD